MKTLALVVSTLLLSPICLVGQHHPEPPGYIQARDYNRQFQQQLDASLPPVTSNNAAQLKKDSAQLHQLAQQVVPELEKLNQGLLAKDLTKQLKEMEKLSKKLRGELEMR